MYQVVRDHFETFRAQAAGLRDGEGLPRFVEEEFRAFLRCGFPAGGFARFHFDDCGLDRLVPFSCKGRAVCARCAGRRMAERAAHLLDHVFPVVPVRQWVVTFPPRLRYRLAWDHDLCRAVVGVSVRTVLGFLRHVAGLDGVPGGRGGALAIIQRFGGALNLNVHVHALVIDGVFARDGPDVRFCPAPLLTAADVADVLATIVPRVRRLLERLGLADQRDRLDRLCRYTLRPTVAQDRLHLTAEGQVVLRLRHPWSDGTTHLLFNPLELLERLAVLIPRPRINLILYHGVLGPRGAWPALVVGFGNTAHRGEASATEPALDSPCGRERRPPGEEARRWADLMRRTFGLDVLACPRCGGRFRLIALIEDASVIERMLRHLHLPTELPAPRPGRAPPLPGACSLGQDPDVAVFNSYA